MRDIQATFVWSLGLLLTVIFVNNWIIRLLISAPFLFLTGHVILRVIGPIRTTLLEHIVFSVGASVAICIMGGFVLNSIGLLYPIGWASWIVFVTGSALVVSWFHKYDVHFVIQLPAMSLVHALAFGGAIVIACGAFILAIHDEAQQHEFKYTEFWMLTRAPDKLLVGIKSYEETPISFDVEVTTGKTILAEWNSVSVMPGETWTKQMDLTANLGYKVEATLYRLPDHAIYRKVSAIPED